MHKLIESSLFNIYQKNNNECCLRFLIFRLNISDSFIQVALKFNKNNNNNNKLKNFEAMF